MWKQLCATALLFVCFANAAAQTGRRMTSQTKTPAVGWPLEKSQPIIDKTQTIRLSPDVSHLSAGERAAVAKLLEVGKLFQKIYEEQRHHQATAAQNDLIQLSKRRGSDPAVQN